MTYRRDLESAHARIAHLEEQLAVERGEKKEARAAGPPPKPLSKPLVPRRPLPEPEPERNWLTWRAWPVGVLAASLIAYASRFGVSLPEASSSELALFTRSFFLVIAVGALLMTLGYVARVRNGGEANALERLCTVLAAIVSAPVLIPGAFLVVEVGSIAIGVLAAVGAVIGGVVWVVGWIRNGDTD